MQRRLGRRLLLQSVGIWRCVAAACRACCARCACCGALLVATLCLLRLLRHLHGLRGLPILWGPLPLRPSCIQSQLLLRPRRQRRQGAHVLPRVAAAGGAAAAAAWKLGQRAAAAAASPAARRGCREGGREANTWCIMNMMN